MAYGKMNGGGPRSTPAEQDRAAEEERHARSLDMADDHRATSPAGWITEVGGVLPAK
jgi:hypothetical protein